MKKTFLLIILILLASCSKESKTLRDPNIVQPVVCTGNLFDGSLDISGLNPAVNLTGAETADASFILSGGQCIINSCDAGYEVAPDGLSCNSLACTVDNAGILNATGVTGDLVNGCEVVSCASNYEVNVGANSCDPISCTVGNAGIANALTVSGDLVNGCVVDSCNVNYVVNSGTNSCDAVICTPDNAGIANASSVIGTLVSGCTVVSCNPNYEVNTGTNSCDEIQCTPGNSGIANVLTVSGTKVSGCNVETCQPNYEQVGNTCQEISCTPANSGIANSASVSGTLVSGCSVVSCNPNYDVNIPNNSCDAVVCTVGNAGIAHAMTVTGDLVNGCTVTSCSTNYEVNTGTNSCDPIMCTPGNSGIANVLTVSGTKVDGCIAETCQANYEVNVPNNSCDAVMCTVDNAGIAHALTVGGDLVAGCEVLSCVANYEVNTGTNSCDAVACTVANAGIDNASEVSGLLTDPQCTLVACNTNYEVNTVTNSCDAVTCTPANSGIAHVLTVTGNLVDGCLVDTCVTNYEANVPNNSCDEIMCTVGNAGIDFATLVSGTKVSGCIVEECEVNYEVNTDTNSCESLVCTVANAGIAHATEVSGLLSDPQCTLVACENNYEVNTDDNTCDAVACTPANSGIANVLYVSGNLVDGCNVVECQPQYLPDFDDNTCNAEECTLVNAEGNGIDDMSHVASVTGFVHDNSCEVASCEMFYMEDNNSCIAKACEDLNSAEADVLGFDLAGGELSGTYPSCVLSCLSPLQELAVDGKSCVDKTPVLVSLEFNSDYTKGSQESVEVVFENANKVRFYSDLACTNLIEEVSMSESPFSHLISLDTSAPGIRPLSAKVINSSLESSCLSDSVYFDNVLPTGSITAPEADTNLLANFVLVQGTCSDSHSGISLITITAGTDTYNPPCVSGEFSANINVGLLPDGAVNIQVVIADNAGNFVSDSVSINKDTFGSIQGAFDNSITALYRQPDGKMLVGGAFSLFTPFEGPAIARGGIARLNTNGTIDETFVVPALAGGATEQRVRGFVMDSEGFIYVAGSFTQAGGVMNKQLMKLNPDGSINTDFRNAIHGIDSDSSTVDGLYIYAIAIDDEDNIYIGGAFTSWKGVPNTAKGIAKISKNGVLDETFRSNLDEVYGTPASNSGFLTSNLLNARVETILYHDNNIYVGGNFSRIANRAMHSSNGLAKLSKNGVVDSTFSANLQTIPVASSGFCPCGSAGSSVSVQPVQSLYTNGTSLFVGGSFRTVKGIDSRGIAKLSLDGVVDTTFQTNINGGILGTSGTTANMNVYSISMDSHNNVYIGGRMSRVGDNAEAWSSRGIAKLSNDGIVDSIFSDNLDVDSGIKVQTTSGITGSVLAISIDFSNNLYLGGTNLLFKGATTPTNYIKLLETGEQP